jgi:hypothetical protein
MCPYKLGLRIRDGKRNFLAIFFVLYIERAIFQERDVQDEGLGNYLHFNVSGGVSIGQRRQRFR